MVVVCQIIINKPDDVVYRAGDTVSGIVKYAMDQPTTFKDIILSFRGESWCSWSSTKCGIGKMYLGIDKHLCLETSILEPSDKSKLLAAGPYEYKFLFTLPKNIPPSFTTEIGNVSYRILLEIQRQDTFNIIKRFVEAEVLVDTCFDHTVPVSPTSFDVTEKLLISRKLPLLVGKLEMSLKAEIASPYIKPGEEAELNLEITNESLVRIKCIRAELISTIFYTASCGSTKVETEKIIDCTTETEKIPRNRKTNMCISVPILEDHRSVQYSNAIRREYAILVTVKLPVPYCNISTEVPILIG